MIKRIETWSLDNPLDGSSITINLGFIIREFITAKVFSDSVISENLNLWLKLKVPIIYPTLLYFVNYEQIKFS